MKKSISRGVSAVLIVTVLVSALYILPVTRVLAQASYTIPNVPHYYQGQLPWCAPVSLEMVFDFYGPHIPASEIATVAGTTSGGTTHSGLRRAAHYSDLNGGYTARGLGYSAFEYTDTQPWYNILKALILAGNPIIVGLDSSGVGPEFPLGHAVVVVGFDSWGVVYHDPAISGGAYLHMSYQVLESRWSVSDYWGLFTRPWEVIAATTPIVTGSVFTFGATVTYVGASSLYPASSSQATITPPSSGRATLIPGEPATKQLGSGTMAPGETQTVSWQLRCNNRGVDTIRVEAQGIISGTTPYQYTDRIGGSDSVRITQPCFIATAAYGSYLDGHVETLRNFRDQYLVPNPVGSAIVSTYYRLSPPIAEFIDDHPVLKPMVRAGLLPAVAMSTVAVNTTSAEKVAIVGSLVLVSVALAMWLSRRRGKGVIS
ncbi:MAG: hypothetical protein E3J81_08660 [Dehalococcoidia bacterium]|nr:MAG: hypothetical protein E3J81_08660 [Dehalococcoidia bacterium]